MRKLVQLVCLILSVPCLAYNIETVILKDGSRLNGYVNTQCPGKFMIVTAHSYEVSIPTEMVWTIDNTSVPLSEVNGAWLDWAENNQSLLRNINGKKYLNMSTLTLKNEGKVLKQNLAAYCLKDTMPKDSVAVPEYIYVPDPVFIIERGDNIKYVSMDTADFYVPYSNVKEIQRPTRMVEELTGLLDLIETRDGTILKGKIVRQEIGVSVSLETESGLLEVISNKNLLIQKKLPLDEDIPMFEQSPLLDVVVMKDGQEYEGILIEQHFGDTDTPAYFIIKAQNDRLYKKRLADLKCTIKKENPKYKSIMDILLEKYEFVINRQKVNAIAVSRQEVIQSIIRPSDGYSQTKELIANVIPLNSPCLKIKRSELENNLIQLEFNNGVDKNFFIIRPIVREYQNTKYESFSDKELSSSGVYPKNVTISKNSTVKLEFDVSNLDKFIIYNAKEGIAIYCQVIE